jgi:hypothetical protein
MPDWKAKAMPQFGFISPWSWLLYRAGWLFGTSVARAGYEARYLTNRAKTASAVERSAWLYRCVISCALIGAEFFIARLFLDSRLDHALSLPLAVAALVALPRPRVRWPLLAARAFVLVTLLAILEKLHLWALKSYPSAVRPWEQVYSVGSILLVLGLWTWVLFALRPRSRAVTHAGSAPQSEPAARWRNVPQIKMQDVGGSLNAKEETLAIARNRLTRQQGRVVQNGILFHGSQGTGKNLLAEAIAARNWSASRQARVRNASAESSNRPPRTARLYSSLMRSTRLAAESKCRGTALTPVEVAGSTTRWSRSSCSRWISTAIWTAS